MHALESVTRLSSIPVIFLSALDDTKDKVKAFQSGGVDYVSKPFQVEEVQVRVETHLQLHRLQRALPSFRKAPTPMSFEPCSRNSGEDSSPRWGCDVAHSSGC